MRIVIMHKAMRLSELAESVSRNARSTEATLESVRTLNPHLSDAQKLAAGTVVILPDSANLKPGVGKPAAAQAHTLSDIGDHVRAGLRELEVRHRELTAQRAAEQSAVRESLKAAAAKRLIESDPVLRDRLAAATFDLKAEQKRIAEMEAQLAETARVAETELGKLLKIFD